MRPLFSTSRDPRKRARNNVRCIARVINAHYFSLPRFTVRCYTDFPAYWRAFQRGDPFLDPLVVFYGQRLMETDPAFRQQKEESTPPAFLRGTTLGLAPSLWREVAELPSSGVVTAREWRLALIIAHELFHLHSPGVDAMRTVPYILEQALADLGALDYMMRYSPRNRPYFEAHSKEGFERLGECLDFICSSDVAGGEGYPRLLATLLLVDTDFDRTAAYRRLRSLFRVENTLDELEESFRQALARMQADLVLGDLAERAFESEPGPANPVAIGLIEVVVGYYGREVRHRFGTDALLWLMGLEQFYFTLEPTPSLEALRAKVKALERVQPRRYSVVDHLVGEWPPEQ